MLIGTSLSMICAWLCWKRHWCFCLWKELCECEFMRKITLQKDCVLRIICYMRLRQLVNEDTFNYSAVFKCTDICEGNRIVFSIFQMEILLLCLYHVHNDKFYTKWNLDSDKLSTLSVIFQKILSMTLLFIHLKGEKKQVRDKKRQRGFEMRIGLQQRWEVVTGLCGDSHPVKPTNVEVMPPAGCSKTVIMKNTGEDNIKWLLYILQWRLVDTKVGWQRHRRQRQALVLLIESLVKSSILAAWKVTVTDILLQTHT